MYKCHDTQHRHFRSVLEPEFLFGFSYSGNYNYPQLREQMQLPFITNMDIYMIMSYNLFLLITDCQIEFQDFEYITF